MHAKCDVNSILRKPNAFLNLETRPHFIRFVDADSSKVWLFLGEARLFLHTILTNSMHDCSNLTKTNPDVSQLLDTMLIIDLGEAHVGPSFISVSVLQFLFLEYIHKSCHDCGESSLFYFWKSSCIFKRKINLKLK
jgi:hypothetical protein